MSVPVNACAPAAGVTPLARVLAALAAAALLYAAWALVALEREDAALGGVLRALAAERRDGQGGGKWRWAETSPEHYQRNHAMRLGLFDDQGRVFPELMPAEARAAMEVERQRAIRMNAYHRRVDLHAPLLHLAAIIGAVCALLAAARLPRGRALVVVPALLVAGVVTGRALQLGLLARVWTS